MFLSCRPFVVITSTPTRPVDNVVITTKGLQDRKIHILDGTTVANKGKLILSAKLSIKIKSLNYIVINAFIFL